MKVQTTYKAGETFNFDGVLKSMGAAGQQVAKIATDTWNKALPTITSPGFWTWPF